jgi:hypothetical protein
MSPVEVYTFILLEMCRVHTVPVLEELDGCYGTPVRCYWKVEGEILASS